MNDRYLNSQIAASHNTTYIIAIDESIHETYGKYAISYNDDFQIPIQEITFQKDENTFGMFV